MAAIAKRLAAQQTPGRFPTALDCNLGIEGHGVDPDIEFIDDPGKMRDGNDPQLDAAVEQLLKEIKSDGYEKPGRSECPDRSKGVGLAEENKSLIKGASLMKSKKRFNIVLLQAVLLSQFLLPASLLIAQGQIQDAKPQVAGFDQADLDKFAKRLDSAHERRLVSGTVLIAVDGKIVFEKSVGYSNVNDKTPLAENSSYRLASVGKQFTAMGIMMLKEDGKLDFDDDITKHLPKLPYKGITIRHLLHHNGGLPDYMDLFDLHWDKEESDLSKKKTAFNKDLVDLFAEHHPDPDFVAGERYQYSNTGYVLLGSIIESTSRMTIHDFLNTRIFEPLNMTDSSAFSPNAEVFKPANRVFGFAYQGDGSSVDNDWHYLNGMVGDGGIYASARDLLKWDQALYGEELVSQTTLAEAFTSGKLNSGKETGYGFGWVVERSKNKGLAVSHGGLWVGFRTSIERQVDRRLTVIVLSNNSTSNLDQVLQAIEELQ